SSDLATRARRGEDPVSLLFLAAHLHLEAVRVRDVEAAFSHSNVQPATLQLRFDSRLDRLVAVPVGQCVGDVVNSNFASRPAAGVARNEDVVAESQTTLCLPVIV